MSKDRMMSEDDAKRVADRVYAMHDKQVADAMGVACALVACGHTSRGRLEKVGVPVFENPAEFKEAFLSGAF